MRMKIGVFTVLFSQRPFEEALDYVKAAGCEAVEIGVGGYPGTGARERRPSCSRTTRRASDSRMRSPPAGWRSARSPATATRSTRRREIAEAHDRDYRNAVQLAQKLGVPTVITFSGCPGGGPEAMEPNWVTCPWPPDFPETLEWQWSERATPYWSEAAAYRQGARRAGRHRAAPRVPRLPHRVVQPAARDRRRDARRQLRSLAPLLAGDGPAGLRPRAGRRHLPRPRQGHLARRAEHRPSTACSTPSRTPTRCTAPGSSAPSATVTARSSGAR